MIIFNAFMKLFRRDWKTLMIYAAIFLRVGTLAASSNADSSGKVFSEQKLDAAIVDQDHSVLSGAVVRYMQERHHMRNPGTGDLKKLNDLVRAGVIDFAAVIPEGFGSSGGNKKIEYIAAGNTAGSALISGRINSFLGSVRAYENAGAGTKEAVEKAGKAAERSGSGTVRLLQTGRKAGKGYLYYLFNFAAYGLLMMLIETTGTVLGHLRDREVRRRISVSSMSFMKRNAETAAGILAVSVLTLAFFLIVGAAAGSGRADGAKFGYYALNLFFVMFPGIAVGYLIASITSNRGVLNIMANSIVLSMCFITGVFVPREILSASALGASRATPLYWFVEGNGIIDRNAPGKIFGREFAICAIIQLLYATVIFLAGLIVSRAKEKT